MLRTGNKKASLLNRLLLMLILILALNIILFALNLLHLISLILITAANILFTFLVYIYFIKRLSDIINELKSISEGSTDLTQRLSIKRFDDFDILSREVNVFVAQIHNIIFRLTNISKQSKILSEELASSTLETSSAVEQISSNIKSVTVNGKLLNVQVDSSTAAIKDIGSSIKNIVSNIETQSRSLSESTEIIGKLLKSISNISDISSMKLSYIDSLKETADSGKKNMLKTLDSMKNITNFADVISEYVKIINDIASQIHILSINSNIQAARAGDYGRGFKVVAQEIQNLANNTSKNSENISSNLKNIIKSIEETYTFTIKTDNSINEITAGINEVYDSIRNILEIIENMSLSTKDITLSLNRLIQITEKVKTNSTEINKKSETIYKFMNDVSAITSSNSDAFYEIGQGMGQILESADQISRLGHRNLDNVNSMNKDITDFKIIDTSNLKSSDGQPLIQWKKTKKEIPPRPKDTSRYRKDDSEYWYDEEFIGWYGIRKKNNALSNGDGASGKHLICIRPENPYQKAWERGIKKISDAFGITVTTLVSDYLINDQEILVQKAIRTRPDMIIINPTDSLRCIEWCKRINDSGIPVVLSNMMPATNEGFAYIIGWTGPDDWGQCRQLSRYFKDYMKSSGGYCCLRHIKGTSNYNARTYSFITELKKIAPEMQCLDKQDSDLNKDKAEEIVKVWLEKYNSGLNGIICADDGSILEGTIKAVESKNREDIIIVSTGHSKTGLDAVKSGKVKAVTYQSAEGDGALAVETAIDWFNGLEIDPVRYLPIKIITTKNVEDYYPPQW